MSSLIQFIPVVTLSEWPIMSALFGGVVAGMVVFALRNNISSGETIIVSLTIRKRAGRASRQEYLSLSMGDHHVDRDDLWLEVCHSIRWLLFCFQSESECCLTNERMQAMIVCLVNRMNSENHNKLHRGATIITMLKGPIIIRKKAVLLTVITEQSLMSLNFPMKKAQTTKLFYNDFRQCSYYWTLLSEMKTNSCRLLARNFCSLLPDPAMSWAVKFFESPCSSNTWEVVNHISCRFLSR